jgi:hypothetical protein
VLWRLPHHRSVEAPFDPEEVRAIVRGVFYINARLADISTDVKAIRRVLEEENGEEEEEDDGG